MAIQDIQNYIAANRNRYSREALIAQLRKNGYPEEEIREALGVKEYDRGNVALRYVMTPPATTGGKVAHWFLGFIVGGIFLGATGWILSGVFSALSYNLFQPFGSYGFSAVRFTIPLIGGVIAMIGFGLWLRSRSRYVARGVFCVLPIPIILVLAVIWFLNFVFRF